MAGENQNGSTIGINTKVVNQNDLLKIINASATTMKNVYNSIIALADACSFLKNMNVRRVKNELNKMIQLIPYIKQFVLEINSQFKRLEGNIKNSIDEECELIKSIGMFTKNIYSILDIIKLDKLPNPAVYRFKMYIIVKVYISIIHQFVKDLVTSFENIGTKFDKLGEHPDKIISNVDKLIKCVTSILNSVNSIKISSLLLIDLKLVLTYISFVKLGLLISVVSLTIPFISSANKVLKWMSENMQYLLQPIQSLSKISIFGLIWVRWKLKIIEHAWVKLSSLVIRIQAMKIGNTRDVKNKVDIIKTVLGVLGKIFLSTILVASAALLAIPALALVTLGVAALTLSLKGIQLLLKIAGKRKAMRKDILKLLTIGLLFATLGYVFLLTILVAPIAAIASLALIVITLAAGVMALCLWGIAWMLSKIPWLKLFAGLFFMNIAMLLITGLALELLIIALAATFVKDKILDILILIGGIIMVVVIMGLLGFCVGSFLLPFMIPIFIGLIAMITIVGLVMLMALALFALSLIILDKDAIMNNVKLVLSTAREVIKMLYSEEEEEPNKVDEPWYEALFNFIGGSVAKIASAIMSIYILAATIVSVLCILLIAAGLWLLQHITLDPVKITSNVTTVIETANNIIKLVFESEDKEAAPSNQGILKSLLGYIDPKLGKIADSIFAISFLAISLISIMIIGFIATNLRILQTIDLDATTISSNVTTVVDTANTVIYNAFKEDTTTNKPTKKGFLSKIIGAVSPGLAKMGDAINAVGFLAVSLGAIALISVIAKELQSINNINISKEAISAKVDIIIKSVEEIIKKVFEKGDDGEWIINGTKYNVGDIADDMHDMFGDWPNAIKNIYNLAGWLQKIVKINTTGLGGKGSIFAKNIDTLTLSVQYMIATLNSKQFQEVSKKNNLNNVSDLADYFADLKESLSYSNQEINNSGKMFAETVKFIDKINGMDMQKLKTAENLFKNLADLSNNIRGNFQGLAEALNEDIAPLLEKLNATIEKANKQTGDSLGRIENYYSAISGTNPDDIVMTDDSGQPLNEEQKEKVVKQNARNTANQLYSRYQDDYKNGKEINQSLVELTSSMRGIDRLIAILDPNLGPTPLRVRNIP